MDCIECKKNINNCSCHHVDEPRQPSASEPATSNDLLESRIFSGDNSRELWNEINSLDAMSTGDDIRDVLYSFGCAMQKLEAKLIKMKAI